MSDGLTDMRGQSEYQCCKCKKQFYYHDVTPYTKGRTTTYICRTCANEVNTPITNAVSNALDKAKGMKFDNGKLQFSLIPPEIKLYLAEILTFGAKKYAPDNWKKIDVQRYYDALERHMNAFQLGEENDAESGMHHLKHALTNMMFITWLELNKPKG